MSQSKIIIINDKMQTSYQYARSEPEGKNFHANFKPELSPFHMLELGIFGGKYLTDCTEEFPSFWFENAKLSPRYRNPELNYFGVNASQSLATWREKAGFIPMIPAAGSNGIAATIQEDAIRMIRDK